MHPTNTKCFDYLITLPSTLLLLQESLVKQATVKNLSHVFFFKKCISQLYGFQSHANDIDGAYQEYGITKSNMLPSSFDYMPNSIIALSLHKFEYGINMHYSSLESSKIMWVFNPNNLFMQSIIAG